MCFSVKGISLAGEEKNHKVWLKEHRQHLVTKVATTYQVAEGATTSPSG
jgi:hypothetical protein